eukprot:7386733-Prymnesium_polylepis.1
MAASRQRALSCASEKPAVRTASSGSETSPLSTGEWRSICCSSARRCGVSGGATATWTSSRPGRRMAGSSCVGERQAPRRRTGGPLAACHGARARMGQGVERGARDLRRK